MYFTTLRRILNQYRLMPKAISFAAPVEVHGHRGCRGLLPENTLPAFLHAVALGVDVLELDVVISADKQVVVSHEPWLNPAICLGPAGERIPAGPPAQFNLYQMPYRLIRSCDCGQLRHPDFPHQLSQPAYKPLLGEVFAAVEAACYQLSRPPVKYAIEIKSSLAGDDLFHPAPAEFLALVLGEIITANLMARTSLLCFDARILRLAHEQVPALATCYLIEDELPWIEHINQLGFIPATLGPAFCTVTPAAVRSLRAAYPNLRLVPWTVNSVQDMRQLMALRVDGITTDYPNRLIPLLVD